MLRRAWERWGKPEPGSRKYDIVPACPVNYGKLLQEKEAQNKPSDLSSGTVEKSIKKQAEKIIAKWHETA